MAYYYPGNHTGTVFNNPKVKKDDSEDGYSVINNSGDKLGSQ